MVFKPIFRFDPQWPKFRLFRVLWTNGVVGDGCGYSAKLAIALRPKLWELIRAQHSWQTRRLCVAGLEVSFQRSFGGIHAA